MHLRLVLGCRSAGLAEIASRFALVALMAIERQQRFRHSLRYGMGYARTTGRRYGLGAGGRNLRIPHHEERSAIPPLAKRRVSFTLLKIECEKRPLQD